MSLNCSEISMYEKTYTKLKNCPHEHKNIQGHHFLLESIRHLPNQIMHVPNHFFQKILEKELFLKKKQNYKLIWFETKNYPHNQKQVSSGKYINTLKNPPLDFQNIHFRTKSRKTHGLFWPNLLLNWIYLKLLPHELRFFL